MTDTGTAGEQVEPNDPLYRGADGKMYRNGGGRGMKERPLRELLRDAQAGDKVALALCKLTLYQVVSDLPPIKCAHLLRHLDEWSGDV